MKRILLIISTAIVLAFLSCTSGSQSTVNSDSTSVDTATVVTVDSANVDTTVVDTTAVK
ncbi:MAG: hypothetical protein WC979_02150 [Candidatus Pacearchaeota archaeon]|jgi:hypothetical protein|nr:hypothetical protein [Clostridia bacterium]